MCAVRLLVFGFASVGRGMSNAAAVMREASILRSFRSASVRLFAAGVTAIVMVATILIIPAMMAVLTPQVAHGASYYSYKGVRSPVHELAYGGLSYAITPQYVNPYYNPASMQFINHTVFNSGVQSSFNSQGLAYTLNFIQGGDALKQNITGEKIRSLLDNNVTAFGEVDVFSTFIRNQKAFGVFVNTRTVAFPQDLTPIARSIPGVSGFEPVALAYDSTNSVGAFYGHSISYLSSIYFGYNLQFVVRQTSRKLRLTNKATKEVISIENPDAGDANLSTTNMALLGDTTIAYIIEDLPISPTFILFVKDIGGQLYAFNGLTTKVGLGTSVSGDLGPVRITSGMEIGNILLNTLTVSGILREIRAGSEISLGNNLISFRGGVYNTRPTFGFGIFAYPISIDYTSYYEELTGIPALKGDDKFIPNFNRPTTTTLERRQAIIMTIPL